MNLPCNYNQMIYFVTKKLSIYHFMWCIAMGFLLLSSWPNISKCWQATLQISTSRVPQPSPKKNEMNYAAPIQSKGSFVSILNWRQIDFFVYFHPGVLFRVSFDNFLDIIGPKFKCGFKENIRWLACCIHSDFMWERRGRRMVWRGEMCLKMEIPF